MKYIVEVNAKYLVSIEAESALQAEHKVLSYNGIWGALAFDNKMIKTDTFLGAVQGCEMVSMTELITMVNEAMDAKQLADKAVEAFNDADSKVKELEEALEAAKMAKLNANRAKSDALYQFQRAEDKLGKQRV